MNNNTTLFRSKLLFTKKCALIISVSLLFSFVFSVITAQTVSTAHAQYKKAVKKKPVGKMLGADISFLPQLESRGMKFSDKGVEKDIFEILKITNLIT